MRVQLISHTPLPEHIVAAAAKLCYSDVGATDLMEGLTDDKAEHFVEMLSEIGHESPIEHASFTFAIEGVSRSLLAQITRHRLASFSVQSQRYVKINDFHFVTPPEIESNEQARETFMKAIDTAIAAYNDLSIILGEKHYKELVDRGVSEKEARRRAEKMAIEDARFVLPNASETKMVVTMNARELLHFFRLRCCGRAQWEIRELARAMWEEVYKVSPALFKYAGPACVHGKCPEGKMSCGKMDEMRKIYGGEREEHP